MELMTILNQPQKAFEFATPDFKERVTIKCVPQENNTESNTEPKSTGAVKLKARGKVRKTSQ